jgi:hypothetical protein
VDDWDAGERGIACLPGREAEFRDGIARALDYAAALACPRLHVMAGLVPAGQTREALRRHLCGQPALRGRSAAKQGVDVLIEPINTRDIPGFFLNRQDDAHALVAEVGAAQRQGAVRPVPLPDCRRRCGHEDPPVPAHGPGRATSRLPACLRATSRTVGELNAPTCSR